MLWQEFLSNNGKVAHKWVHYFPIYERYLKRYINRPCIFWEIGVSHGGSLPLWKKYLGPFAKVIGIDIDPRCVAHEDEQCKVRIGSQSDTVFLQSIIDEFGPPDIVLDDGSHMMNDLRETFCFLYPNVTQNGIYMVEDLHTCYWDSHGGGLGKPDSFIEICKYLIDYLNAYHTNGQLPLNDFATSTFSMSFYDSVVVFEKMQRNAPFYAMMTGSEEMP